MKFRIIFITIIMVLISPFAHSAESDDCNKLFQHAQTFYWLALEEYGDMAYLKKSEEYLDKAQENCSSKMKGIALLKGELEVQKDMSHDTIIGVFPLSRFLVKEVFSKHEATETFELFDDDVNIISLNRALLSVADSFVSLSKFKNGHVVLNSFELSKDGKQNSVVLESEALYSLNSMGGFFVTPPNELRVMLGEENSQEFYENNVTKSTLNILGDTLAVSNILVMNIDEEDYVENISMFKVVGSLYDTKNGKLIKQISAYGFAHDRTPVLKKAFFLAILLLFIGIVFSFSDYKITRKLSGFSHKQQLLFTMAIFFVGITLPSFVILPLISSLAPSFDQIIWNDWWWPILAYALCIILSPLIMRTLIGLFMSKAKGLAFKTYDDKNYIVLSLGIAWNFIFAYMLYFSELKVLTIVAILTSVVSLFAVVGRYMQATFKNHELLLIPFLLNILVSGVAFLSGNQIYLYFSAAFCFISFLLSYYLEHLVTDSIASSNTMCEHSEIQGVTKLIDAMTHEKVINYESVGPHVMKEKTDGVKIHDSERILHALQNENSTGWLNVVGVEGVGKSWIIKSAIDKYVNALNKKPYVLTAKCESGDSAFGPFRRALKLLPDDIFNIEGQQGKDSFLSSLVEGVIGDFVSTNTVSNFSEEFDYKAGEITNALKVAVERKPVIIIIEDCDFLDHSSKQLLPLLADMYFYDKEADGVTFIFSSRDKDKLLSHPKSVGIDINIPTGDDMNELLSTSLKFSEAAANELVSKSFYHKFDWNQLMNLLKSLASSGRIVKESDNSALVSLKDGWCDPPPSDLLKDFGEYLETDSRLERVFIAAACYVIDSNPKIKEDTSLVLNNYRFNVAIISEALGLGDPLDLLDLLNQVEVKSEYVRDDQEEDQIFEFSSELFFKVIAHYFQLLDTDGKYSPQIIREIRAKVKESIK